MGAVNGADGAMRYVRSKAHLYDLERRARLDVREEGAALDGP